MSRRSLGWLLLLGWSGAWAGISLTAYLLLPENVAHPPSLVNWPIAALGSAVGGYFAPHADKRRRVAALGGFLFGAAAYLGRDGAGREPHPVALKRRVRQV